MQRMIEWFQLRYPHYRETMIVCRHNLDDAELNPYHLESDCWSHTMMVCKLAELEGASAAVKAAALLHDLGKPAARGINPRNRHVRFFGHEGVSAILATEVLFAMQKEGILSAEDVERAFALIALHSLFFHDWTRAALRKKFRRDPRLYEELLTLSECDAIGRFSPDLSLGEVRRKYRTLREYAGEMKAAEIAVDTMPQMEILFGWNVAVLKRSAEAAKNGGAWILTPLELRSADWERRLQQAMKSNVKKMVVVTDTLNNAFVDTVFSSLPSSIERIVRILLAPALSADDDLAAPDEKLLSIGKAFELPLYDRVDRIVWEYSSRLNGSV